MKPRHVGGGLNICVARCSTEPRSPSTSTLLLLLLLLLLVLLQPVVANVASNTHSQNEAGQSTATTTPEPSSASDVRRLHSVPSTSYTSTITTINTTTATTTTATPTSEVAHRWWVDRRVSAPHTSAHPDATVSPAKLLEFVSRRYNSSSSSTSSRSRSANQPAATPAITTKSTLAPAAPNALFTTTEIPALSLFQRSLKPDATPPDGGASADVTAAAAVFSDRPEPFVVSHSTNNEDDDDDSDNGADALPELGATESESDNADPLPSAASRPGQQHLHQLHGQPEQHRHVLHQQQLSHSHLHHPQQQQQQQQQQHPATAAARSQLQHITARAAIKGLPVQLSSASFATTNSTPPMKGHKTDAPMLNYIFDSHLATNKHIHHDRNGPQFEDAARIGGLNVTVQIGTPAYLNCRVNLLQDKTVSWVKRETANDRLDLLTVGRLTYTGDARFSAEFQYPNNWRLRIADANKSDEGEYECQISTYPPRVIQVFLCVRSPEVCIADEHGALLVDKFYEVDSTIQLVCIVRHIAMTTSAVYWLHGDRMLNFDMTRGGISVRTDLMDNGANSTLSIAKIGKQDSGNYTCSIGPNDFYTMTMHVLNGESLAELYHGSTAVNSVHRAVRLVIVAGMLHIGSQFLYS